MSGWKRKTEPDENGEDLSEDTREMWTVPDADSRDRGPADRTDEDEAPDETREDRFEDENGATGDGWEETDGPENEWEEENEPDDEWYEDEDGPTEPDDEPYYEEVDPPGDDWNEDEEFESPEDPVVAPHRSLRSRFESIEWPAIPEPDPGRLLYAVAVAAVALAVGFGTYQLGKSSGPDLDTARIRGEVAGRQAGAIEGAATGYPTGYRKGREKGFARAYRQTYRIYYRRAFEQAGLDVPGEGEIKVPAP